MSLLWQSNKQTINEDLQKIVAYFTKKYPERLLAVDILLIMDIDLTQTVLRSVNYLYGELIIRDIEPENIGVTEAYIVVSNSYMLQHGIKDRSKLSDGPCYELAFNVCDILKQIGIPYTRYSAIKLTSMGTKWNYTYLENKKNLVKYLNKYGVTPVQLLQAITFQHTWVVVGTKHYDSEAVDGVDNPLDLPIFQRAIARAKKNN